MTQSKFALVIIIWVMLCFPISIVAGEKSNTTILRKQELSGSGGKEGVMLTVTLSPGESAPRHRHNADTFVYVLEGTIVMQIESQMPVVLKKGDTFYESPEDIHKVSKNASDTQSAKFLVFIMKEQGDPLLLTVK